MEKFKLRRHFDTSIPIVGLILSIVGLVMILSSSQISAAQTYGNSYYFFIKQLAYWGLGIVAFFYFLRVPLESLYENRVRLLWVTLVLLVLVFIPYIGPKIAGVHRWVDLGFFSFQSAEVAKLLLVIYFAGWFAAKRENITDPIKGLLPFLVILTALTLLVIAEPDMGTAFILIATAMIMFFAAGANIWQYISVVILGIVAFVLLIHTASYRLERLTGFLNRNTTNLDSAYHGQQALIAIGSGGWWGVGFGQGISKQFYLPQSHTDSIFAVIGEELGFVRTGLILAAYFYLAWRGIMIFYQANSRFVQLLSIGLSASILLQMMINVGGMLNVLPLTGVPMPFISYGGSSLIVSLAMLGLLTNASREKK